MLTGLTDAKKAAKKIQLMGAKNVIVTGFTETNNKISDFVLEPINQYKISGKKIPIINHGSGCNYSASITESLAKGLPVNEATKIAKKFVYKLIKNSINIGKGINITHEEISKDVKTLRDTIDEFIQIRNIHKVIPECQTNFVLAKTNPKTINDVLGISGRLVKAGKEIISAGEIIYGGSLHVASAVIHVNKKFPEILSCINIKYDTKIIAKAKKIGLIVLSYDRSKEPKNIKMKENSSIIWGISSILKTKCPDLVFHKGDFGKEPMILIFGKTPNDVIKKVSKLRLSY